jgi:hypothetical protein
MIVLACVVALAIATNLLSNPRPRVAYATTAVMALVGAYIVYAIVVWTTSERYGAQAKVTGWPVTIVAAACIMSAWHGRALLKRRTTSL